MAGVHTILRNRYSLADLAEYSSTPAGAVRYMSHFLDVTYDMASALIDANTLNSIDPMRCFAQETTDVCRLSYWEVQSRRKTSEHYVNIPALFQDQISHMNLNNSRMDCRAPHPEANCLHWEQRTNPNLTSTVVGLTPEEPAILEDRKTFPFAQVVPLSPIIWQTRAPEVPCCGFGDTYNTGILGAGDCKPNVRCDHAGAKFDSPVPNPDSGRIQSVFVAYENDAFSCLDRAKEDDAVFYDKSWDPWASYTDLTVGRKVEPTKLMGKNVYYKFISDVRYLKAPIKGTVYINKTDPCQPCTEWSAPECTDPLEVGPSHPMWQEKSISDKCSFRRQWIKRFLDDEKTPERESSFLTSQTTELSMAALVITPQMESLPDITTLVMVTFVQGQNGAISASPWLVSISETPVLKWCSWCGVALTFAILYPIHELRKQRRHICGQLGIDICLMAAVCTYIIFNMYLEFSPPHVLQELLLAFQANEQHAYFECFAGLLGYAQSLSTLKNCGFYVIIALFFRLVVLLDVHPRLGLLIQVARKCADDTFHFMMQFTVQYALLSYLAFWSFGESRAEFSSMTRSAYTLFRYFVGEFNMDEAPPDSRFLCFLILYVFIIFVMMVNFLLAIVVTAHTKVMHIVEECQTEQNALTDMWDVWSSFIFFKQHGWPSPGRVLEHLVSHVGHGMNMLSLPAVTAEELVGSLLFASEESAQNFIDYYAEKMDMIQETRKEMRFQQDHCFLEECNSSSGALNMIREACPNVSKQQVDLNALRQQLQQSKSAEKKLQMELCELRRNISKQQWDWW
jgi:hypothetical protein